MPTSAGLVAVVGGGLAGMAAAARLAKMGHAVRLHEATDRLGGSWAARPLDDGPSGSDVAGDDRGPGLLVDDAPGTLAFPAPWRDLFRKSGRPLEAELARSGYALVPAPPPVYRFADGSTLALPSERGEQHDVLVATYGPGPAARWQHLVDSLDDVWQALRPLGLEEAYDPRALGRDTVRRLRPRRRLAELADALGEPHLRAVVRSVAHRQGTTPERAPALAAVELLVGRTFGRWQVAPDGSRPAGRSSGAPATDVGRSSVLTEALVARLDLRGVEVRTGSRVEAVETAGPAVAGVRTAAGLEPATAVVLAVDPWSAAGLLPGGASRALGRALRGASPVHLPVPRHVVLDSASGPASGPALVREDVRLDDEGRPVVVTTRRLGGRVVRTTLDHRVLVARPGAGLDTDGFRGWRRRPGTATALPAVVLAGAASPAGASPSMVVQTGALATYAAAGRRD